MIEGLEIVEYPTFVLSRFGRICPLAQNEITWLLRHRAWHLIEDDQIKNIVINSPHFDAKITRIDRINKYANKVFLEAI